MFNSKLIFSITIFITFLIVTSLVKNQSRILEKKISKLNSKVLSSQKNLSETELEFFYLTSPLEIEKRLIRNNLTKFKPINYSNIFFDLKDFIIIEKKLSNLRNKDEKENYKKQTN